LSITRQEQKTAREAKKQAKIEARAERRRNRQELKGWLKMVAMAKMKGAWIEDENEVLTTN
jgi:hypothetical protein